MRSISLHFSLFILLLLITVCSPFVSFSQVGEPQNNRNIIRNETDSTIILNPDSIILLDSNAQVNQTKIDTTISPDAIKSKVEYDAEDSMKIDMRLEKVYLYGKAQVNYENIQLNADYIEVDLKQSTVLASGAPDSSGNIIGKPIFKEGAQEFSVDSMQYNFKSKKGKIYEVRTQEGEGFIKGHEVKKDNTDIMYIRNGYYTTCNLDHPHFSLATNKLKVIPGNKIVTGPTVLKINDIPTPLGLPFGFFPNKKGRSSGIIIPTYGDSRNLGFFLQNGGFYWGINEYVDASITGDIYSLGSWGTNLKTRYKKRYQYNGEVNLQYTKILQGFREAPNFSESNNFFVRWNHAQDTKARPGSRFSANVNAGSQSNFQNNINSSAQQFLTNTFQSSITYSNSFPSKPFNLNISARHNQNTRNGDFNLSLPEVSFNLSRQYPLKNLGKIGNEWWRGAYKNFGFQYSSSATNQLSTNDTMLAINNFDRLLSDFRSGIRHSVPISTSFKLLKYANVNPSITASEIWAFKTIRRSVIDSTNATQNDTIVAFERANTWNFNTALTTKLYSLYQYKKGKVAAIRHVMTPTVSFNYQPEITAGNRTYTDTSGTDIEYNIFQGGVFGSPNRQRSGRIGLGLLNNIEMKVRTDKDSSGIKKITLLENLAFNTSYNLTADSLNWAVINASGRTRIGNFLSLQFNGTLDPYGLNSEGTARINKGAQQTQGNLLRLTAASTAINFTLRGGDPKKKEERRKSKFATQEELDYINAHPEQYIDFNIPWSLNVNYNIRYSKPLEESTVTQTLNFSGDLNITEKWKISATSGWDIENRELSYTSLNINRDLHCWQLAVNWIPIGVRQSYNLTLNVKASVLQDLKLNRNRNFIDRIR